MFILHHSNKTENLVNQLAVIIGKEPLKSPLAAEQFLIQSQGMERWLAQQLATQLGVFANYNFLFPSKFFSQLTEKLGASLKNTLFDRHTMVWRIEMLLRQLQGDDYQALNQYLSGVNTELKRYQLAQQLAQLFDQYQIMRPELLKKWQQGELLYGKETERWQRALWLNIIQQLGNQHRGILWQQIIHTLDNTPEAQFKHLLPERVFVFGMNTMPPLFLDYLRALAKHTQVHLCLLNPSRDYWADIASKRQLVHDETHYMGHPLLSSLGQQGREFQEMLLDKDIHFFAENDYFTQTDNPNLLQRLQNDILNNSLSTIDKISHDNSISLHACHSRLREVEVLKQTLLASLENDNTLELRDIIVMSPDIAQYEPFISAVFSDIQHAIADRSLRLTNRCLDAFIRFLKLCQSRFGWQAVLDLLEHPAVYPRFNLNTEQLELIKHWVTDTQVRWAKSAQHKAELGLPALNENTWQAMLNRLFMGYAVGCDDAFIAGILPYKDIEGGSAFALGALADFMGCLFNASTELTTAKSLMDWTAQLNLYAAQLLTDTNNIERQQLSDLFAELSHDVSDIHRQPIELTVVISWLMGKVEERKSANGFLRGQLTFCSMLPMRSIPFKIIALLGINEGEFPKVERKPTFDLLADNFQKGDRSRRADDRYQFLEILLSARQQLIITYIGQSIQHNAIIPTSVIVSELLDILKQYYNIDSDKLMTYQPLQAFSKRYFIENSPLINYAKNAYETALALQNRANNEPAPWWQGQLTTPPPTTLELTELFNFFKHPQRYFMRRQLNVHFSQLQALPQEREPFHLEKITAYTTYQQWIKSKLAGEALNLKVLQARGVWLAGNLGELAFTKQESLIEAFVAKILNKPLGEPLADLSIDYSFSQYRLIGLLEGRYQGGSVLYRYAELKGKDFMAGLIQHHLFNTFHAQPTYLISSDSELCLLPEHCNAQFLGFCLETYQQGLLQPNSFFTEAAFAYIKQNYKLQQGSYSDKTPLMLASETLKRAIEQDYELELQRLYSDTEIDTLLDARFVFYCEQVLQPLWNCLQ